LLFLKKILQLKLKYLAKIYLWRTKPAIIIVAGTTNRQWIKEYIIQSLEERGFSCRGNKKHFNAEIGLPLSVLGIEPSKKWQNSLIRWLDAAWRSVMLIVSGGEYLDYLVLETAIDQPDDMDYFLGIIQPQIAILTTITMIYPENFSGLDEIASEYRKLIEAMPQNGLAVLNADDQRIANLAAFSRSKVIKYGIESPNSDYLADNIKKDTFGLSFRICLPDMAAREKTIKRFGRHHIYAELVANIVLDNI
jgi:UDP-N-acetylmuramoyl-tripeptide--D-alanyl-D-alanine ligase